MPILTSATDPFTSTEQSKSESSTSQFISQPRIKAGKATRHLFAAADRDIALLKRVIWKDYNEQVSEQVELRRTKLEFLERKSRRARDVKIRKKFPAEIRKIKHSELPRFAPMPPTLPVATYQPVSPSAKPADVASKLGNKDLSGIESMNHDDIESIKHLARSTGSWSEESGDFKRMGCTWCTYFQAECLPLGRQSKGLRCYNCIAEDLSCSYMLESNYPSMRKL